MIDGPVICTASGDYVAPLDPWSFEPRIEDIAHHLANQCRFSGATRKPYSVGEHSCRVADIVPAEHKLAALLHDASEYLLQDMARPLKHDPQLGASYRAAEEALQNRIAHAFDLPLVEPDEVRHADMVLLATERRDLMPGNVPWRILLDVEPLEETIRPWSFEYAKVSFLQRYYQLVPFTVAA